jgi:hypothetical protein
MGGAAGAIARRRGIVIGEGDIGEGIGARLHPDVVGFADKAG